MMRDFDACLTLALDGSFGKGPIDIMPNRCNGSIGPRLSLEASVSRKYLHLPEVETQPPVLNSVTSKETI